jgi:6-phosphogluconate dehydrogenase
MNIFYYFICHRNFQMPAKCFFGRHRNPQPGHSIIRGFDNMTGTNLELGIVGLGKMGNNLAKQALEKEMTIVGMDTQDRSELEEMGATVLDAGEYDQLVDELDPPRAVYLSLPAGSMIDDELDDMVDAFDEGDVIMDGGNSFWRDSMRREERVWDEDIFFLDCGSSGGPFQATDGLCFMVGGKEEGYEIVEPILDELSVDGGLMRTGPPGSGHFVKLVHNGVEFGMLQSIAEGVELLEAGDFDLDLGDVFTNWSNGSVIRSWLVELMAQGLKQEDQFAETDTPDFEDIPNYVEDTGEVNWLVQEAFKGETPIPVISQSVIELFKSRGNQRHAYQAIALMRHGFGNHPFGEADGIEEERITGRVTNEARSDLTDDDQMDPVRPDESDQ